MPMTITSSTTSKISSSLRIVSGVNVASMESMGVFLNLIEASCAADL